VIRQGLLVRCDGQQYNRHIEGTACYSCTTGTLWVQLVTAVQQAHWVYSLLQLYSRHIEGTACYSCTTGTLGVQLVTAVQQAQWGYSLLQLYDRHIEGTACYSCTTGTLGVQLVTAVRQAHWGYSLLQQYNRHIEGTACYSCTTGTLRVQLLTAVQQAHWGYSLLQLYNRHFECTACYSCTTGTLKIQLVTAPNSDTGKTLTVLSAIIGVCVCVCVCVCVVRGDMIRTETCWDLEPLCWTTWTLQEFLELLTADKQVKQNGTINRVMKLTQETALVNWFTGVCTKLLYHYAVIIACYCYWQCSGVNCQCTVHISCNMDKC
jgi:hypothetical protein